MLLPKDVSPINSLYFNGGNIIKILKKHKELGFIELFLETKASSKISMGIFALSLDWLYLAAVVRYNENEKIELCF